ncbi:Serine/threonine-protein kinase pkn1 [Anatilimnocola aggregata]|uniref:Serine/threonine-protein kinase pkn1 n=1 Tax=Anatilimnocola aggregata TaxID=2528021 RepID=A0A517YKJ0_9BACT|nr:formylglycine-generating enzyme family protein [Anatilimnocola aggregata]QDU30737.1 Serine/threonine-protein kinase pkn1 [Anatilimnocola aggregata]
MRRICSLFVLGLLPLVAIAQEALPPPFDVPDSTAKTEAEMKPYTEVLEHAEGKFQMLPIKGGKFLMGSPPTEKGRKPDEGPQHEVQVDPFWMAKFEISWDVYDVWASDLDIFRREALGTAPNARDKAADKYQLTQPTKPYTDMSFGMGKRGYPAICMTQHSARVFCQWLSVKTGRYYRLPTEAEWEYACRAGTTTAYSFGDDPADLGDYAWYTDNSEEKYQKIGLKKPNPWGLHDMHGNVAEWVLDQHSTDFYGKLMGKIAVNPLAIPLTEYNRVVRGGSWDSDAVALRSASRVASHADWKQQDPQLPQSIWYLTDALGVGFRVVRPLTEPTAAERAAKWDKSEPPQIDRVKKPE